MKDLEQLLVEQGRDNLSFDQRIAQVRRVVGMSRDVLPKGLEPAVV